MLVITIPGVLFDPLREGAYASSRDVAEAIDHGEQALRLQPDLRSHLTRKLNC